MICLNGAKKELEMQFLSTLFNETMSSCVKNIFVRHFSLHLFDTGTRELQRGNNMSDFFSTLRLDKIQAGKIII